MEYQLTIMIFHRECHKYP